MRKRPEACSLKETLARMVVVSPLVGALTGGILGMLTALHPAVWPKFDLRIDPHEFINEPNRALPTAQLLCGLYGAMLGAFFGLVFSPIQLLLRRTPTGSCFLWLVGSTFVCGLVGIPFIFLPLIFAPMGYWIGVIILRRDVRYKKAAWPASGLEADGDNAQEPERHD